LGFLVVGNSAPDDMVWPSDRMNAASDKRNADQRARRAAKKAAAEAAALAAEEGETVEVAVGDVRVSAPVVVPDAGDQMVMTPDGAVLTAFMQDWQFITIIRGPWGCLSGDTEVLTPGGWVRMDAWGGEHVAEWEPAGGTVVYRAPQGFVKEPCEEFWHFRNEHGLSMVLSDEHRVAVYDWSGRFTVKSAADLAEAPSKHRVPVSFRKADGGLGLSPNRIRLLVAIAADGHEVARGQQISVALRREHKKTRLRALLSENGVRWDERARADCPREIVFTFDRGDMRKGLGPEWYGASLSELEVLVEEAMFWDGSRSKGEYRFSTTKMGEAEVLQFAAHATGRRATISTDKPREAHWSDVHCVQITAPGSRKAVVGLRGDSTVIERVKSADGRKYCFTTSTGFFVARHNGRIFITGNSGKSVACCGKLYTAACMQEPDRHGVRRSRWFIVRNTYPDLQETTVKTWLSWFPEEVYGHMRRSRPFQHVIKVRGADVDGKPTRVEMEVLFLALDDDDDRKKLLSMEFTGGWVNEAREIAKSIIDDLIGRTGRFPSMRDGGPTWAGVIMDTNAPAETHWLPQMMGEVPLSEDMSEDDAVGLKKPADWNYYVQPGALREVRDDMTKEISYEANPAAENTKYLKDGAGWYLQRLGGKTRSWIRVNFCNLLGSSVAGKPVWPTFARERHVAPVPIPFDPNLHLYVGVDQTGRNPAAAFGQVLGGRWRVVGELVGKDISSEAFAPLLRRKLSQIIAPSGLSIEQVRMSFYRDPHNQRNDTDDNSSDLVYRKHGILLIPAPGGNGIKHRTETVEAMFDFDRILISPTCTRLIAACEGGYRFRKLNVSGEVYDTEPDKRNGHADIADGLQYLMLGAGEGRAMMKGSEPKRPVKIATGYRPGQNRETYRRKAHA